MEYFSTRNKKIRLSDSKAIIKGIADDGGLFVPNEFKEVKNLYQNNLSYFDICKGILKVFFPNLDIEKIDNVYENFDSDSPVGVSKVGDDFVMELYHGPTCAFKDFALVMLPTLLEKSLELEKDNSKIVILTATSGDTGTAALNGFANIDNTKNNIQIIVMYPTDGVSEIQKKQMTTQVGDNVSVIAINGNFDDAQSAVKEIFMDSKLKDELSSSNIKFSSANSINIGRLVPQIAYYFQTYKELLNRKEIEPEEKINFCVPTANFGDILAGYYAKRMGLPIDKLICASNDNNVLNDFLKTGIYDRRRDLKCTISPSMDIIVSSNIERLLYHISEDDSVVSKWMDNLKNEGFYNIYDNENKDIYKKNLKMFSSGFSTEQESTDIIKEVFSEYNYLIDPHTAVAWNVAKKYKKIQNKNRKMVILSTASPYKFVGTVCDALGLEVEDHSNELDLLNILSEKTQTKIPYSLSSLKNKEILHNKVINKSDIKKTIKDSILNRSFCVKVPATTANIGAGFDTLGIALNLSTKVSVNYSKLNKGNKAKDIDLKIKNCPKKFSLKDNLIYTSYLSTMKVLHKKKNALYPETLSFFVESDIPMSRGLGSSAACIVAGVVIAFKISGINFSKEDILKIANNIEGHPDNIAPAIYGGFRASSIHDGEVLSTQIPISNSLKFITIVPNFHLSTKVSREVLPNSVDYKDAIYNISHTATTIGAFINNDFSLLRKTISDKLHQDYRGPLIKNYNEIVEKCLKLGALGVYLSGAGPTIIAIENRDSLKSYRNAISKINSNYEVYELEIDEVGMNIY